MIHRGKFKIAFYEDGIPALAEYAEDAVYMVSTRMNWGADPRSLAFEWYAVNEDGDQIKLASPSQVCFAVASAMDETGVIQFVYMSRVGLE